MASLSTVPEIKPIIDDGVIEEIIKICRNCGAPFTLSTEKRRGAPRKYCTSQCSNDVHYKYVFDKDVQCARQAKHYTTYPEKRFLATTKMSAKNKNIAFSLTEAWFKERLDNGVCEVTGLPIKIKQYKKGVKGGRGFYSPSIDRIDNSIGYIPSNCRLVAWGYNLGKNKFTDRDLNNLSVALLIRSISPSLQKKFLAIMPPVILAGLPSGHQLF